MYEEFGSPDAELPIFLKKLMINSNAEIESETYRVSQKKFRGLAVCGIKSM